MARQFWSWTDAPAVAPSAGSNQNTIQVMAQRLLHIEYVVTLAIVMAASGAKAQEAPAVEVAGGYQVHAVGGFPESGGFDPAPVVFSGWYASAAWNATSNWGLVFEAVRANHEYQFTRFDETRDLVDGRLVTVRTENTRVRRDYNMRVKGVGIRYRKATGRVKPFAQLVVGPITYESVDSPPPPPQRYVLHCTPSDCVPEPFSEIPTGRDGPYRLWMMWPGGGVDIQLVDRAVVRLQADSVGMIGGGISFPRFLISAVYQIGSR